jgi:hypothetical protein
MNTFMSPRLGVLAASLAAFTATVFLSACGGGTPVEEMGPPSPTAAMLTQAMQQPGSAMVNPSVLDGVRQRAVQAQTSMALTPDQLMNWAQLQYPSLFPGTPMTVAASGFVYRFYPGAQNFIAVTTDSTQGVYVLGALTANKLVFIAPLTTFTCLVYPMSCMTPYTYY